jgi:PKD repeat protein
LWDFGDGSTSTQHILYHTYKNTGEYNVKLTVTDNNGLRADETIKIMVQKPEIMESKPLMPIEIAVLATVVIIAVIVLIALLKRRTAARK